MDKPFKGLRTCCYVVEDIGRAKLWYSEAFQTKPYFDEPFYIGYNIGGYELGLLPLEENSKPVAANVLTYWGVEDAKKQYLRLLDMGATKHEDPMDVGEGIITASVRDPWGNVIGIIQNPYFSLD